MNASSKPGFKYLYLLKAYPLFRKLFAARAVSLLGDWLNLLALLALLRELNLATPQLLGGLFILKLLPNFFMSPFAGVIADRFSRQHIMIWSDLVRFGIVVCYFFAPLWPEHATYIVLTLVALQAASAAFFEPAKTALLPDLVPKDALAAANGLSALTWSVTYALGSTLGGIITYFLGWRIALVLDASSYLLSAWFIISMGMTKRKRIKKAFHFADALGFRDMLQGFGYIKGQREVAYTMLLKAGWSLAGSIPLLLTLYGERKYHFGNRPDIGTAFLFACRAVGTGLGPIVAQRFVAPTSWNMHRAIWFSFGLGALFYFAFGTVGNVYLAGGCIIVAHMGGSVNWVYSTVRLQQIVPQDFRGRVFAAELGAATLMISISTWGLGFLAEKSLWQLHHLAFLLAGLLSLTLVLSWLIGGVYLKLGSRNRRA